MELFVVVIALAFSQVWGTRNPLHNDAWFNGWLRFADSSLSKDLSASKYAVFLFVGIPVAIFWFVVVMLLDHSVWTLLPVSVLVLLYAFGRSEFSEIVREYTQACYIEDWPSAIQRAQNIGADTQNINENDWSTLHRCVLDEAAYRGFERMFAVLFWFFLLGPVAALAYRLLFIFVHTYQPATAATDVNDSAVDDPESDTSGSGSVGSETSDLENHARENQAPEKQGNEPLAANSEHDNEQVLQSEDVDLSPNEQVSSVSERESFAEKCLWILEWPAARLLGLTFALTGNFSACMQQWRHGFIGGTESTKHILSRSVMGALSISEELDQTCEVTRKELTLLTRLYTRTLWLWLALAAFLFLFT